MLNPSELQAHETVDAVSEAPGSSPESVQLASVSPMSGSERASSWTDCRMDSAPVECSGTAGGEATEKSIILETAGSEGVLASRCTGKGGGGGKIKCYGNRW